MTLCSMLNAAHMKYANTCSIAATIHTFGALYYTPLSPHWSILDRPILANGLLWTGDHHRVSEGDYTIG